MTKSKDCLFCKILRKEIPCNKVYENDDVMAFEDIQPLSPNHYLFVPKVHIESLANLSPKETDIMSKIYSAILEVTKEKNLDKEGFRTVINTGVKGGQTVYHLHVHVMGGKQLSGDFS